MQDTQKVVRAGKKSGSLSNGFRSSIFELFLSRLCAANLADGDLKDVQAFSCPGALGQSLSRFKTTPLAGTSEPRLLRGWRSLLV